jgi:hypothetical protein
MNGQLRRNRNFNADTLVTAQTDDRFIRETRIQNNIHKIHNQLGKHEKFSIIAGILHFNTKGRNHPHIPVEVLPSGCTRSVMEEFHNSPIGGH